MTRRLATLAISAVLAACGALPEHGATLPSRTVDVASVPDAVVRDEPRSLRGNPPFYEVFGQRYAVLPTAAGYAEQGIASWYGPGFHANATSMGEPYDMYAMTAAHKTLPIPCYARVTHLGNGRSVIVRINDRGPFVGERVIDLSYAAAMRLDMIKAGTAPVELVVLSPGAVTTAVAARPVAERLYVQAGAFAAADNAYRLAARLTAAGLDVATVVPPADPGSRLYRVRIGPVADVQEFDRVVARLTSLGLAGARLATY